ncbi:ligand-binding sensor domain-containing protein/signal transduction histidine kinase/DNA-binding response OmpR family regulator [Pedobacter sp. W3I1]|uniref:hybrid sensor histidine kinase/response regulator transcription factor n=1 Tax=Pedobacter sp. W3I1 TaxID=3042291 RepID=UPI002785330D|nr:hybrid sensor histidine kinase/response regulator transcription factor [Pedobacter sp. W3I1]MDQ0638458.1 ligand-binding sensor domain-containing protein/signal transduction histidine kinase/DNA-binding response OmpR family regulator [Pedobacter sp. W3I1]
MIKKLTIFSVILLLWQISLTGLAQEKPALEFVHLTTANGLSESKVNCILKDKYGFMWFGTQDGLNKYDGYKFKVYRSNPKKSGNIPYNNIKCLFEDRSGKLWIGTLGGGLAFYDRNKDAFISVGKDGSEKLNDLNITSIFEDRKGRFWVGTTKGLHLLDRRTKKINTFFPGQAEKSAQCQYVTVIYEDKRDNLWVGTKEGLSLFDLESRQFESFMNTGVKGSISDNIITAISTDHKGNLWIGTTNGLNRYDYQTRNFVSYKHEPNRPESLADNVINALCSYGSGKFWVATEDGLDLFDIDKGSFMHYRKDAKDERSLSNSSVYSMLLDGQGILWLGTYAGGVNKYDRNQTSFKLYRNFGLDRSDFNSNIVTSFAEDHGGDIWIGTDGGGLYLWNRSASRFTSYNSAVRTYPLKSMSVLSLRLNHKKDKLWIGTYDMGLACMDINSKKISYYPPLQLRNKSVYALLEDRKGQIWIGTNGGGVNVLDPVSGKIKNYSSSDAGNSLSNNFIRSFYEDRDGKIWIGTHSGGISVLDPERDKFVTYNSSNSGLSNDMVYALYGDHKGRVWIGTMGGGLNVFDPVKKRFNAFTETEGLASNIVSCLVEDKMGYFWISTDNGLSRFDPKTGAVKNYSMLNGLQSNEFILGSGGLMSTGEVLFGGLNGFNIFDPASIKENRYSPPVVITDFLLFNRSILGADQNLLKDLNINETKEITLSHDQSVFTIEFSALSYTVPEKTSYAYKLEGFDQEWNYIGHERKATYTNLNPGTYTFTVKAANSDGIWSGKSSFLKIIIEPPFWKTIWAYLFYLVAVSALLYLIYVEIRSREKLRSEVKYQKLAADKMEELNQLKFNFFTNISHELRTPLSLIIDPLRKMMSEEITGSQAKRYSQLVYKNAGRLMNLVNQLLDFRKLENGNLRLDLKKVDIISILQNIVDSFNLKAADRKIDYFFEKKTASFYALIDTDKFEKILFNLISNAFKYTPDFGEIIVSVAVKGIDGLPDKGLLEIHVKDTGIGIPVELREKIFDVFYQVKDVKRFENVSSGIGLALTKELVLLHNGEISVEGDEKRGSDFVIRIPVDTYDRAEPYNRLSMKDENSTKVEGAVNDEIHKVDENGPQEEKAADLPIILIVEDNQELREYVAEELQADYQVEEAANGIEGFERALKIVPDLIISDVMMPESDGLEMCNKLKNDERTSHIPVVLLTAKQAEEHKIDGYSSGADAYISKPFNMVLLVARIKNILESRSKLRMLYLKGESQLPEYELVDIDLKFIKKATQIVEEHVSDPNFDIDKLAGGLRMSRRQLYRKLKALTNQTAHDFVNGIKLEMATRLLLSGDYTISEIAYRLGFSEPANFSRSFTREHGVSPKKYINDQKQGKLHP